MLRIVWFSLVVSILLLAWMWQRGKIWNLHLVWKVPLSLFLVLVIALSADSGIGMTTQGDTSSHLVEAKGGDTAPKRLFLLLQGYNGRGSSLLKLLGPHLQPYGTVKAFEPSLEGYDDEQLQDAALREIAKYDEVIVYCESFRGMTFMNMLRRSPELRVKAVVFNATPSRVGYVRLLGNALKVLEWAKPWFQGGPLSTWALRRDQRAKVGPLPQLGTKADTPAAQADRASLSVTGKTSFAELRAMARFEPPTDGEFAQMVEYPVRYISAPGDHDDMVETNASFAEIEKAFPGAVHHKMPWYPGEHTPTPRRAESVAKQILIATGLA